MRCIPGYYIEQHKEYFSMFQPALHYNEYVFCSQPCTSLHSVATEPNVDVGQIMDLLGAACLMGTKYHRMSITAGNGHSFYKSTVSVFGSMIYID